MERFTHAQLVLMSRPASDTEENKMENARIAIYKALAASNIISSNSYEVFGQGSYANNTNIRNNSDVDINVCYTSGFFYKIPDGVTAGELGLNNPCTYSYSQFKNDIERMLKSYFGANQVLRKNKCIHVNGNTYRSEIDVVPTWKYRRYTDKWGSYQGGGGRIQKKGQTVDNYPKQHLRNGIAKNDRTSRRYKRLVRIVKSIKARMEENGFYSNSNITSFLIEGLVYNFPDSKFDLYSGSFDWNSILRNFIFFIWNGCGEGNESWKEWVEPSECLYLMYGHKWNYSDVKEFTHRMWNYLGY